ncbi:MAG: hypothetical protein GY856_27705 [bacterium]|nr:hypothetical protein [bacterium]
MSQSNQHHVPTFRQILLIDPVVFLGTLLGCGGSLVIVPVFLYVHFSGPEAWLETAGSPVSILEVVGITLLLALLPLLATMPFVFRRTAMIRRTLRTSEEVRGKIQFVKATSGIALSVLFTYKHQKSEQIRRISVLKRRAVQEILRTGQEIRVLVDRNDPRRVLIKDVFDPTLEKRR